MKKKRLGLTAIDLFCGAGGFSHGFTQAGFDIILGIDFWNPALDTHEINGLGKTRKIDLRNISIDDIIELKMELNSNFGEIDVLIGSPPCTEFSYSKNGGSGDIKGGMLLVLKYLAFVGVFAPRYWLLENVPRLEQVLDVEFESCENHGWRVKLSDIGINQAMRSELGIIDEYLHIPFGKILNASDYGTRQRRNRFIAGKYPLANLEKVRNNGAPDYALRPIIDSLNGSNLGDVVIDPNYEGHEVKRADIRDNCIRYLHPMHAEEARHQKRRHIQYGIMDFPENLDLPARTIMATHSISSRESFILGTNQERMYQGRMRKVYRQPSVREVAAIQGFPLDFQLDAPKLSDRYRLIGNAVPCQLSYALARAIIIDIQSKIMTETDLLFKSRFKETLRRQRENDGKPIIPTKQKMVEEATDFLDGELKFKGRPNKHIRRRLISSKTPRNSATIIFENTTNEGGEIVGGLEWKVCLQCGVGRTYNKVIVDESITNIIINAIDSSNERLTVKKAVGQLFAQVNKGIPLLDKQWEQFVGYDKFHKLSTGIIKSDLRLDLPSISDFQNAFTNHSPELNGYVGPIDLFDGLDVIMGNVLSRTDYSYLLDYQINLNDLITNPVYQHCEDKKILWYIENKKIPYTTILGGLVGVHVLAKMYEKDEKRESLRYYHSLNQADKSIRAWIARHD